MINLFKWYYSKLNNTIIYYIMPGALMQLVAYGAQNIYLTGNPQMTFWKATYRRCTNFAIESIEQVFKGQGDFGNYLQCLVGRNGDLISQTYLVVTLPEIDCCWTTDISGQDATWARWIDYPGENLIDYAEIEIGGTRIDRQYGEWMHIWNQLTLTNEKREGYYKMIGHTTELTYLTMGEAYGDSNCICCKQLCDGCEGPCNRCAFRCNLPERTLFIPLLFWYCRNPGLALPLIALQYHAVYINIQLRGLDCMLWAVDALNDGSGNPLLGNGECGSFLKAARSTGNANTTGGGNNRVNSQSGAYNKRLVTCSLFIDYVFLDRDERRYMAQNPHQYLVEQVQFNGLVSTATSDVTLNLEFNHPCKELFLTTQQEYFRDCCKQFEACEPLYKALGIQPFNYTDCLDAMPPAFHAFHGPNITGWPGAGPPPQFGTKTIHESLFKNPGAAASVNPIAAQTPWDQEQYADGWKGNPSVLVDISSSFAPLSSIYNSFISDAGAIVLAETALNMHCWGKNPIYSMVLQLNGQDRFSERQGTWFDVIQPFKYHTHIPDTGINVYSFSLYPENHNPSGTLNFSRIDNSTLRFILSNFMFNANNQSVNIKLYATNYNILRIMSGMGGLAYSN